YLPEETPGKGRKFLARVRVDRGVSGQRLEGNTSVSNNLLDALSGGIIRMEPLCQIALERSIPDVADVLTISIVADFGGGFEQLRLYHQGEPSSSPAAARSSSIARR